MIINSSLLSLFQEKLKRKPLILEWSKDKNGQQNIEGLQGGNFTARFIAGNYSDTYYLSNDNEPELKIR